MSISLPLRIDFGTSSSPVEADYTKFGASSYSSTRGFGWLSPMGLAVVDTLFTDPVLRDCVRGTSGTFRIDVPDGTYLITIQMIDPRQRSDKIEVTLGGSTFNFDQMLQAQTIQKEVVSAGGFFTIQFQATGPATPYFGVASITVESETTPPPPLIVDAGMSIASDQHSVTFTPNISGGVPPLVETWDYGDGSPVGTSRTHNYANGTYIAVLVVVDSVGQTATDSVLVTVNHEHEHPPPDPTAFVVTRHENIPDFAYGSGFETVKDGNWHDPSVWSTGTVPGASDKVNVKHVISLDQLGVCHSVTVHTGAKLDQEGSQLSFVNFLVRPGGTHRANGAFRLVVRNIQATDADRLGTGYISLGETDWVGSRQITHTWSRLTHEIYSGMTTIHLETPCPDWKVGDEIIIPDTRQVGLSGPWGADAVLHNEYATISSISVDGKTVTLSAPVQYDHPGAWGYDTKALQWSVINGLVKVAGWDGSSLRNGIQLHFVPAVANITREAKVFSEDSNGTRGHVMFVGHGVSVQIRNVRFEGLGRYREDATNPDHKGRYGLHFHHAHSSSLIVDRCAIIGGYSRTIDQRYGITLHGVCDSQITNNVVWNWRGSGIWTEVSTHHAEWLPEAPIRNLITGNWVANIWGPEAGPESISQRAENGDGFEGAGIWLATTDDIVQYNWIACCTVAIGEFVGWYGGYGALHVATNPGDDPYTTGAFYNTIAKPQNGLGFNEMVACTSGWVPWNIGAYGSGGPPYWQNPGESVVKGQVGWNLNREHTFYYVCQNITQIGAIFRGNISQRSQGGMIEGDYRQKDLKLDHCDIQGATVGFDSFPGCANTELVDCDFQNNTYAMIWTCRNAHGVPTEDSGRSIRLYGCEFANNDVDIQVEWTDFPSLFASDKLYLFNHQRVVGINYQVFRNNQRGDFVPPSAHTEFGTHFMGSPEVGKTNAELYSSWEWKWDYGEPVPTYRSPKQGGDGWLPACVGAELLPDGAVSLSVVIGGKVKQI